MGLSSILKRILGAPERRGLSSGEACHGSTPQALATPPSELLIREVLNKDGYTLIEPIGSGGSGEVWVASNEVEGHRAVKIINLTERDGELGKLEFDALHRLEHLSRRTPALIDIHHIKRHAGFLYYTMPLAENAVSEDGSYSEGYQTLSVEWQICHEGPRPVSECVHIALCVLDGLDALHTKKLRHGDVKPSNIVYVDKKPVLADIGLVAIATNQMNNGTEGYVPPEGSWRPSADHYALGKTIYRMASGLPVKGYPAKPTGDVDLLFAQLNKVISIACDKDPDRRYINAKVFRTALLNVLEPQAAVEPSSTWPQRIRQWRRRGPDIPAKAMFKKRINLLIDGAAEKLMVTASPSRDHLLSGEYALITDEVGLVFERRLGYLPIEVKTACDYLMTIVEPDEAEQQMMLKTLVGSSGVIVSATNVFDVMSDIWGLGRFVAGGVWSGCKGLLDSLGLRKKNPAEHTQKALDWFKKGMQEAIDNIWERDKDALMAR